MLVAIPGEAIAHVSEQGIVLLLPTGIYTISGVAAVALTVMIFAAIPDRMVQGLFRSHNGDSRERYSATVPSLLSMLIVFFLVWTGWTGTRDPLENLLPLAIWTVWWIGLVALQAIVGDVWHFINPWTGFYQVMFGGTTKERIVRLPESIGRLPALILFLLFAAFYLAYPSPDDPAKLAIVVGGYWLFTFAAMIIFGSQDWLARGECFTVLMRLYASIAPVNASPGHRGIHFPGSAIVNGPTLTVSASVFAIVLLGTGSFDGLNETFWWLAIIGVNPLEFPGRSAVIWPTITGLLSANLLLLVAFALSVWGGLKLIGETYRFSEAFGRLALTILPIAAAYHIAHYLVSFLVNGQYVIAAANDSFGTGANVLGLDPFYVTTGFLNTRDTVQMIWLTQASVIVAGHMLAVMTAHAIAIDMFKNGIKALKSQIPLAMFMILYTLFGLWLLAAPRGA